MGRGKQHVVENRKIETFRNASTQRSGASPGALTCLTGRLLCDPYLSSRELFREVILTRHSVYDARLLSKKFASCWPAS